MGLPGARSTVRRLMIAAAVAAVLAAGYAYAEKRWLDWRAENRRLAGLSASFRKLAEYHSMMCDNTVRKVANWHGGIYHHSALPTPLGEYHRTLSEKYRSAAERPWLPVTPDPPEPE
jgi:hypothetical protein